MRNSEFCFPKPVNEDIERSRENIEGPGETKLTVSRGASH